MIANPSTSRWRMWAGLGQIAAALAAVVLLLMFLVWLRVSGQPADRVVREVATIEAALPAPAPPDPLQIEAPPPPPRSIPRLEVNLDRSLPALASTMNPEMDFSLVSPTFEEFTDPLPILETRAEPRRKASPKPAEPRSTTPKPTAKPVQRTTYRSGELDSLPRLVNRPSAPFPASLARQGVTQGRVVLEVNIDPRGRVSIRRVISSTHPDLVQMARTTAARARFSSPTKDGRPVTAIFHWPLILRK